MKVVAGGEGGLSNRQAARYTPFFLKREPTEPRRLLIQNAFNRTVFPAIQTFYSPLFLLENA